MAEKKADDKLAISLGQAWLQRLEEAKKARQIYRPNCKFCNHKLREDAEEAYEKQGTFTAAKRVFDKDTEGEKMTYENVRNHLLHHYKEKYAQTDFDEHAQKLAGYLDLGLSQEQKLEFLAANAQMLVDQVLADPQVHPTKKADVLSKLGKLSVDIIGTIARLRATGRDHDELATIFTDVWTTMLQEAEDDAERGKMMVYLDKFRRQIAPLLLTEEEG